MFKTELKINVKTKLTSSVDKVRFKSMIIIRNETMFENRCELLRCNSIPSIPISIEEILEIKSHYKNPLLLLSDKFMECYYQRFHS